MISVPSKNIKTAKEALGNGPYQIHYALKLILIDVFLIDIKVRIGSGLC